MEFHPNLSKSVKLETQELTDEELEQVSGGGINIPDIDYAAFPQIDTSWALSFNSDNDKGGFKFVTVMISDVSRDPNRIAATKD
jgi:bacteriocin-like protein